MWTEERVELLKKLWGEGLSASQVAKQLGGVTRNAVIGKVHRLGLSGRATVQTARSKPAQPKQYRARPRPAAAVSARSGGAHAVAQPLPKERKVEPSLAPTPSLKVVEEEEEFIDPRDRATVLTLTERTCKWPIGDPGQPGFHFCGKHADPGSPYCEKHQAKAYQPQQPRRQRESQQQRLAKQRRDGFVF